MPVPVPALVAAHVPENTDVVTVVALPPRGLLLALCTGICDTWVLLPPLFTALLLLDGVAEAELWLLSAEALLAALVSSTGIAVVTKGMGVVGAGISLLFALGGIYESGGDDCGDCGGGSGTEE